MSIDPLITGARAFLQAQIAGLGDGLANDARAITDELKQTTAHGDVTGATRAGYIAFVVGEGETGASALAGAVAAADALNPGMTATAPVTVGTRLGVIVTDVMSYGPERETEHAGQKATLGPLMPRIAAGLTQSAAAGAKQRA